MVAGLVMVMLLLAACGGETVEEVVPTLASEVEPGDSAGSETGSDTTSTDSGFTATVSGAYEGEVSGSGYFVCSDEMESLGGPVYLEIQNGISATDPNITIRVRLGTEPGTYPLLGWDEAMSPPQGEGLIEFDEGAGGENWGTGSGEITFEAVPDDAREAVTGSFSAELTSMDTEGTVNVSGEFDFTAPSYAFDEGLCTPENRAAAEAERAAQQSAAENADLPDVPDDLAGMTVNIEDVENGFSAADVPMQIRGAVCVSNTTQWVLEDDLRDGAVVNVTVTIPTGAEPGVYPVSDSSTEGMIQMLAIVLESDSAETTFRTVTEGAIRLDAIPTASGEPLAGAFSVQVMPNPMLSNNSTDTISVEGVFNLDTSDDRLNICES
jgi:hypothetical protein